MPMNALAIAKKLIANGYRPVPCTGKRVLIDDWPKRDFTEWDFKPSHNVGIKTGDGIALVDIDVTDPKASAAIAAEWLRRHQGALQRTGKAPKTAFLVASDIPSKVEAKLPDLGKGDKIEILASGQQFVAYGIHPDTQAPYHWHGLDPLDTFLGVKDALPFVSEAELLDFLKWVRLNYGPPEREKTADKPLSVRAAAGFKIDTGSGGGFWRAVNDAALADRDLWVPALFPTAKKSANGAWRITSRDLGRDYQEDLSIHETGITDFGPENTQTAISLTMAFGGAPDAKAAAFWICEKLGRDPQSLGWHDGGRRAARHETGYSTASASSPDLICGPKGKPIWCAENACAVLETDPAWAGVLAYDEFAAMTLVLQPIPGTTVPRSNFTPRALADTDITAAVRWFNRNGFPDATKNTTADAMQAVAAQAVISPVRHYLEGLTWDGTPRVDGWLSNYCGAAESTFTRKAGAAWLVSAVARALSPGCKADCALVLEGRQGAGKSSAIKALAGEAWFHDGLHDLHSKDASAGLRGKWIIELPELSAMRRSDVEAVKAFLSRTEERYRPAYARAEVVEPRRCVFAGTTNRTDYLTDDTGGRRFWPVTVGKVDVPGLTRDRDQIWAEAVARFRAGESWWLDREAEAEAAKVVATRAAEDPWEADVLRVVASLSEVSTRDVFQLLEVPLDRRNKADAMRITGILTRGGWSRAGKFTHGANRDLSRYVPATGRRDGAEP